VVWLVEFISWMQEDLGRYPGVDFSAIRRGEGTLFSSLYGRRHPENVPAHSTPVYATPDG